MKKNDFIPFESSSVFKYILGIIVFSLIGCTPQPELLVTWLPLVAPSQNILRNSQAPILVSGGKKPYTLVVTSGSASGTLDSATAIFKSTEIFGKTVIQITDARKTVTTTEVNVVDDLPIISYAGSPFIFQKDSLIAPLDITNTGGAIISCSISPSLPTGLIFNLKTCSISGTPSIATLPIFYTITASNSGGNKSVSLNITVNDYLPSLVNYADIIMIKNSQYSIPAPANSGGAIISYSSVDKLPAGLALNSKTGVISGIPTSISAMSSYIIKVAGLSGSTNININITVIPDTRTVMATHSKINDVMPPVKVVLIVDNSGSMSDEQANLALGVDKMLNTLSGHNLSFYMYTTTSINLLSAKNLPVSSITKPVASFENIYTYEGKTTLEAPGSQVLAYSVTANYTLNDSLLGNITPTFSALKDNSLTKTSLVEEIKKVGIKGDGANEAGICTIGRILADESHKVVNNKDAKGKSDKVAFVILSDENDFSTFCNYSITTDYAQNPRVIVKNTITTVATQLGAISSDGLMDGIIIKANQMFGKDGYMVSAIIKNPGTNMGPPGTPYERFLEKLPNQFGIAGNINSNDYSKELEGISNFVIKNNAYNFQVNLVKGETIKSVQIEKNSAFVDVKFSEVKDNSGLITAISIVSGDLLDGDKIKIVINKN